MIDSYVPKQDAKGARPARHWRLELVRNPKFRVWSPAAQPDGYPDRIVLDTGYTVKQAVARVAGGRADLVWLTNEPLADPDQLQTRHGPQLHRTTGQEPRYVYLNATKPPFKNHDARRAVAYALDRAALASGQGGFSGRVTCQVIPPNFVAYRPYCPFTVGGGDDGQWTGLDFATALDLVERSGTRGAKVVLVVVDDDQDMRKAGRRVVALLDSLGYRASLRSYTFPDFYDVLDKHSDWNAGVWGWDPDYPAPSQLLPTLASCDPDWEPFNLTGYCDKRVDKAIAAAFDLQVTDPAGASEAWAAIDRMVVDAAALIPFADNLRQDFVSRRVGNTRIHPVTGALISQMWVQ